MQQSLYSALSFMIFLQAIFLQGAWLYLGRRARNVYLGDIMQFRTPSSFISRFYDWRVTRFVNVLIEGVVFQVILVGSLILLSLALADLATLLGAGLYVVIVMFLSFVSTLQMALRVKAINEQEKGIVSSIATSTDKIGIARELIENLMMQGSMGDGRVWFALYRLALRPNQVGWAIRDVLIEKGKEMREMFQYSKSEGDQAPRDDGPGIDS
jgi:hypothetical protein